MNFKKYLESQLSFDTEPTLNEKIKQIVKDQLDTSCTISISKKKDLMEGQMKIAIKQYLTEVDARNLVASIEALPEVKKVENWETPEEEVNKPTEIIVTLEQ